VITEPAGGAAARVNSRRYAVLVALLLLATLASTPEILGALHLRIEQGAPRVVRGVRLLPAPSAPPQVALPSVAMPIDPGQPPATLPAVSATRQAATVAAEDSRIRFLVHDAAAVYQPEVVPTRGSLPTLVLTAGSRPYTYSDLVQYGALVMLPDHAGLLLDNVFVATNAQLDLGAPALRALYLDSSPSGFASIVAWGGSLSFEGTPEHPLTIMGWDRTAHSPAKDDGSGRAYIREVGGRMVLMDVRAAALGFWSGRTGGVAWTGSTGQPSTGAATDSTFTNETYGAFVTRGKNITFRDDLFEFNELDGLHIHRNTTGTLVTGSAAVRNGGSGFLVDRATSGTTLNRTVAEHNAEDGFLIDGRPLVTGASASGGSVAADTGTSIENSAALDNQETGIDLEGGMGTVLKGDEVCAKIAGVAIRDGAENTIVTGDDVRCGPRVALELGPAAPQTMVSGNTLVDTRVGMLIRSSGPIETDNNRIVGATVFGITARGWTSHVSGQGNVISGTGFRAVDARADAPEPALIRTQDSGWAHQVKTTAWSYLIFHPLAMLWLSILILVLGGEIWSRTRRMPPHPYPASTRWRPAPATTAGTLVGAAAPAATAVQAAPATAARTSWPVAREEAWPGAEWLVPERERVAAVDGPRAASRPPLDARPSLDRPPLDHRPPLDDRPPLDRPPLDTRPRRPLDRPPLDDRPPPDARPPLDDRPPLDRAPLDTRPRRPLDRPPLDDRPPPDARPPLDRPALDARPPLDARPSLDRLAFDRPPFDTRPPLDPPPLDSPSLDPPLERPPLDNRPRRVPGAHRSGANGDPGWFNPPPVPRQEPGPLPSLSAAAAAGTAPAGEPAEPTDATKPFPRVEGGP